MCSAKKDRPEDKKRRRRVVDVLVLVSAVSSVARAFPRRVFRVFVVVALSLSYEFSKLRVNNYLVVVPFSSFSVCLFDLFRSFVVAFFFLEREERRGTLLRERRLSSLATSIIIIALLYKKKQRDEREREREKKKRMLREARELCYKHRDAYHEALKKASSKKELRALEKLFEKHCPRSWVDHFEKIRLDQEKFTKLTSKN